MSVSYLHYFTKEGNIKKIKNKWYVQGNKNRKQEKSSNFHGVLNSGMLAKS